MGCKINPNTPILPKIPHRKSRNSYFPSCSLHEPLLTQTLPTVKFQTLKSCKLGIARYPDFDYNAEGGSGNATVKKLGEGVSVSFDIGTLYIPPLSAATTRFLSLPLPPFLKIDIVPEVFEGVINRETGKVDLRFRAKFWFSVGTVYRAPPLAVETTLTTEESKGVIRSGKGERMDGDGRCRLVGVATVDRIDDVLMNSFLGLPTDCLAVLNARISVSEDNTIGL